jgi:hypothetical protein
MTEEETSITTFTLGKSGRPATARRWCASWESESTGGSWPRASLSPPAAEQGALAQAKPDVHGDRGCHGRAVGLAARG